MDRITELLAKLAADGHLPVDELAELQGLITAEAAALDDAENTPEVAETLEALADALDKATAERDRQDAEAAAIADRAAAARARLTPVPAAETGDGDDDEPGEGDGEGEQPAPEPTTPAAEPAPEPIAAAAARPAPAPAQRRAGSLARAAARAPQPRTPQGDPRGTVTYTSASSGRALPDTDALNREFGHALVRSLGHTQLHDSQQAVVAAAVNFPRDRFLDSNGAANGEKVRNLLDTHATPTAIVAAGGLCAPVANLYDIRTIGVADRPLRDAFPSMGAERGGVSLRGPILPGDMAGAIGTWTIQNDIDASTAGAPDPTKPYAVATCNGFTPYYVEATTQIVEFNNVTTMYDPEQTAAVIDATDIAFAITAENKILTKLNGFLTPVTQPKVVGAVADILVGFDRAVAWWKTRRRLSDGQRFHAIGPRWVRDLIRADMVRSLMNKGGVGDPYAVAEATINGWFAARNIRVTWHYDGRTTAQASAAGVPAIAAQAYAGAALTAAAALPEFPDQIEWQLTLEGDVLYLDGGEINLGVVRDSSLNSTNKYRTFREEFFGLAWRGADGLQLVQTVDPTGLYAGWLDTSAVSD